MTDKPQTTITLWQLVPERGFYFENLLRRTQPDVLYREPLLKVMNIFMQLLLEAEDEEIGNIPQGV